METLLFVRGVIVSYEVMRTWCRKFGYMYRPLACPEASVRAITTGSCTTSCRVYPLPACQRSAGGLRISLQRWRCASHPFTLRMIERFRRDLGANLAGIVVILDLLDHLTTLQHEVEQWRMRS